MAIVSLGERLHGFSFGIAKSGRNGIYPGGGISFFEVRYLHPSTEKLYRGGSFYYVKNLLKYWGIPRSIVSNRDGRFKDLGPRYLDSWDRNSTSQQVCIRSTEGQTERMNALLEEYLRHFVSANQKNWVQLLDVAQFCYN